MEVERQASREKCSLVWAQAGMPVLLEGGFGGGGFFAADSAGRVRSVAAAVEPGAESPC